MKDFYFIPYRDPFKGQEENRLLTDDYMPASVQTPSSKLIRTSGRGITNSFLIPTGTATDVTLTLTELSKNPSLIVVEWSIFIGSSSDPLANLLPGGSAVNHANWFLRGPIETPYAESGTATQDPSYVHRSRITVGNDTGSSHIVTTVAHVRIISNSGGNIE